MVSANYACEYLMDICPIAQYPLSLSDEKCMKVPVIYTASLWQDEVLKRWIQFLRGREISIR